jgi:2-C-methyl-D-erythritol 4-phosphate cytidylyltransferase
MKPDGRLSTAAVIPAAGAGVRMGGGRRKQFMDLAGRPLLAVTLRAFQECPAVDAVVLVVPEGEMAYCRGEVVERYGFHKVNQMVVGGARRQDSVRIGVAATAGAYEIILIHDAVRPLIDAAHIEKVIEAAVVHGAVTTGLPAKETVKEVDGAGQVIRTYDRKAVWLVQTPQAFRYELIREAHARALSGAEEGATDDALLVERLGVPVKMIKGLERNIKVTTPSDLELARFLLSGGR